MRLFLLHVHSEFGFPDEKIILYFIDAVHLMQFCLEQVRNPFQLAEIRPLDLSHQHQLRWGGPTLQLINGKFFDATDFAQPADEGHSQYHLHCVCADLSEQARPALRLHSIAMLYLPNIPDVGVCNPRLLTMATRSSDGIDAATFSS